MSRRLALAAVAALLCLAPGFAGAQSLTGVVATPSGDGVLTIPVGGDVAFSLAVINYAGPAVPARVLTHWNGTPSESPFSPLLARSTCRTDPATAACITTPFDNSAFLFEPGNVMTFSVFVHAFQPIPDHTFQRLLIEFDLLPEIPGGPYTPWFWLSVAVRTP